MKKVIIGLLLIVFVGIAGFSGYQIITILSEYKAGKDVYQEAQNSYVSVRETSAEENDRDGTSYSTSVETGKNEKTESRNEFIGVNSGIEVVGNDGIKITRNKYNRSRLQLLNEKDGTVVTVVKVPLARRANTFHKGHYVTKDRGRFRYMTDRQKNDLYSPVVVDWDGLFSVNADTIGWIYVEGCPEVSFPVVQGEDDDYYTTHTFDGQVIKSGAVFLSALCKDNFTSPLSLVFGHNMRNGTMFSPLYDHRADGTFEEHPYFWILTPEAERKYEIITIFEENRSSPIFRVFQHYDDTYEAYLQEVIARNEHLKNPGEASKKDPVVVLVTCVPDTYNRVILIGKLVHYGKN